MGALVSSEAFVSLRVTKVSMSQEMRYESLPVPAVLTLEICVLVKVGLM